MWVRRGHTLMKLTTLIRSMPSNDWSVSGDTIASQRNTQNPATLYHQRRPCTQKIKSVSRLFDLSARGNPKHFLDIICRRDIAERIYFFPQRKVILTKSSYVSLDPWTITSGIGYDHLSCIFQCPPDKFGSLGSWGCALSDHAQRPWTLEHKAQTCCIPWDGWIHHAYGKRLRYPIALRLKVCLRLAGLD